MSDERGSILAEALIAALLMGIAVSSVVGGLLSASRSGGRSANRERAAMCTQQLLNELKNYVTADPSPRPEAPGFPAGTWNLPGDPCGCWALQEGVHDATALLPADFRSRAGASMRYTVSVVDVSGEPLRRVQVSVSWQEPPP